MNLVLNEIKKSKASFVIFDIDGTLKDLCAEHTEALRLVCKLLKVNDFNMWLILVINSIAMFFVKTGVFPTNKSKQNFLVNLFAIIAMVKRRRFKEKYYAEYNKQIFLFEHTLETLNNLRKSRVFFATINEQNYNLEEYNISQDKIVYSTGAFKINTYKKILSEINVNKEDVMIVGDNIFDDVISAKILGVKSLLVNNYNSRIKKVFCKFFNRKYLK